MIERKDSNYCSLEVSKRLVDAGIAIKTDMFWMTCANSPWLLRDNRHGADEYYPAPSMAEVWRELPWVTDNYGLISMNKADNVTYCGYRKGLAIREPKFESNNPTDALIDLLIFVRKGKP